MRISNINNEFKVHAIAGTYVVTLGFDLPEEQCTGLLGFSILRTDSTGRSKFLEGMKCFSETDPGFPAGAVYPSNEHPIQIFQWADYSAEPGNQYIYKVSALKGTPTNLQIFSECSVEVTTESPEHGEHAVYFNRGTAASQEYVRRFGDKEPKDVPENKAFEWLSRGLYEAIINFIDSCKPKKHSLRIAAYEFNYVPLLEIIEKAIIKGIDIQIVYDSKGKSPGENNNILIDRYNLRQYSFPRTTYKSGISHNKFIVKLENNIPISLLTGGTNYSSGGIFGHSNVAHIVNDKNVADLYMQYWTALRNDIDHKELIAAVEKITTIPDINLPTGTSVLFSPRKNLTALTYYADLALSAKDALFMTFAFGMNRTFKDVYQNSKAGFRLALLEKKTRGYSKDEEDKKLEEEQEIQKLRNLPENIFSIGNFIRTNKLDGWMQEQLSGLNKNVNYIHNKFMLIDPLSDDPIVVCGSANFSDASTIKNDENMILIRGNTKIADIYLGEFMRLFSHFSFRESLQWRDLNGPPKPLRLDNWWKSSFGDSPNSAKRKYFAQVDH
ncbi:phospholipase D-like domain-containing protein [Chryseobacterium sp.]|uniref:phospholipase D-like domain-containing protein n=1 Tax=Chryseobacterium sp. TaxID=1871047 RepID=UPI0012D142F8|nr:phospholipase D-like domain-containing protein [Chryseobacterium sp.]MPS66819.1 hypothetical protein [Chryseobacterium sp.]